MRFTHILLLLLLYQLRNGEGFLNLSGLWTASFQVAPHPGRSVTLYAAPQTSHGITILRIGELVVHIRATLRTRP